MATSYGLGSSSSVKGVYNTAGSDCTGLTKQEALEGFGDYIEIQNLQPSIGTEGALSTTSRICGSFFVGAPSVSEDTAATACSFVSPFKIGVHFDEGESLVDDMADIDNQALGENLLLKDIRKGQGLAYSGFWLSYWMNYCTD